MKRIGTHISRGQITTADSGGERIQLFDGRFDTGYRVTRFEISFANRESTSSKIASGKLTTEPATDNLTWDWSDVTEIAWAWAASDSNGISVANPHTVIDRENMLVEDVYINVYSYAGTETVNYLIEFEKYDFSAYDGAGFLIKNLSQAGPQ